MLSLSCSRFRAPRMGQVTRFSPSTQARASWAGAHPALLGCAEERFDDIECFVGVIALIVHLERLQPRPYGH